MWGIDSLAGPLKQHQLPRVCIIELRRYSRDGKTDKARNVHSVMYEAVMYQRVASGVSDSRGSLYVLCTVRQGKDWVEHLKLTG